MEYDLRAMLRKTLTILSLLGLLLSVGLWGVSIRYYSAFIPKSLRFQVTMSHGQCSLFWPDKPFAEMADVVVETTDWQPSMLMPEQTITISSSESIRVPAEGCAIAGFDFWQISWSWHLGFRSPMSRRGSIPVGRSFSIPLWIPTLLLAVVFWRSFSTLHRRRKRRKLALCLKCGYDLRASKERCPECGRTL